MLRFVLTVFLLCGLVQTVFSYEEELRLVAALTEEGFPSLAQTVLNRTLRAFPAAEKFAPELRIRILIAAKKFDEAQNEIAAAGNPAPLWLFLAETAGRARQLPVAEAACKKYFESGGGAEDAAMQAVFHCGGLLEERGDRTAALHLYEQVMKSPGCSKQARPVAAKLSQLLVSAENPKPADLDRAKKLCEEVQLGGLDLWFGKAVVTWSQVMQLKGDWDESLSVLETQLELLKQLEENLEKQGSAVSSLSPLAGARFLLGTCYERADRTQDALHQFYNVYAKYGDSEWGPQAQMRAEALIDRFRTQGRTVQIDLGPNRARLEENAFRVARRMFFDKKYTEALPALLGTLNKYPEGEESVTALRELLLCQIHLKDDLGSRTVAAYLAERFAARDAAAEALLAAGKCALDGKQRKLADWMYDRYFCGFPRHARVPAVLHSLASLRRQDGDSSGEEAFLNRIAATYPDSPHAFRALCRLAWNAFETEKYAEAAERFEPLAEAEPDPEKQMRIRFALAEAYRLSNDREKAHEKYRILEEFLDKTAEGFGVSEEQIAQSKPFYEKSIFYQGDCLAKLGRTEEAVRTFDRFADLFPGSDIIPQVQFARGSALMELKQYDAALASFSFFDETAERKFLEPVLCGRGKALFETGRYREAVECLETLLTRWPESAFFFEAGIVQGSAYAAAGQSADAVRVLSDVLNAASTELQIHRAGLALGRAQADPAEKLASFQRVALLADPAEPAQGALIAQALYESLPLYLKLSRPQELLADSTRLAEEFPDFGRNEEIEAMRRAVRQEMANDQQRISTIQRGFCKFLWEQRG